MQTAYGGQVNFSYSTTGCLCHFQVKDNMFYFILFKNLVVKKQKKIEQCFSEQANACLFGSCLDDKTVMGEEPK